MDVNEALDIVLKLAGYHNAGFRGNEMHARYSEALDVVDFARPFLATAFELARRAPPRTITPTGRRALDLGGG